MICYKRLAAQLVNYYCMFSDFRNNNKKKNETKNKM